MSTGSVNGWYNYRDLYTYDAKKNVLTWTHEGWSGGHLNDGFRYTYTYDPKR